MRHVSVIGCGLLGGSIALAAAKYFPKVSLWGRRQEGVDQALAKGIAGATTDLAAAIAEADLIILATPVGAMPTVLGQILAIQPDIACLLTDVGSVKGCPHELLPPLLAGSQIEFIGSHPMAGSEKAGVEASRHDLFDGAACVITNDEGVAQGKVDQLVDFWQKLGCRCSELGASCHDEVIARVSHMPHVIASVGATVGLKNPADGQLAGSGLRDTTRVASGDASMWAEILLENRLALKAPLQDCRDELDRVLEMLERGDRSALEQWLAAAKDKRDQLATS